MCVCVCVYIHAHTRLHTHAHKHARTHTHTHAQGRVVASFDATDPTQNMFAGGLPGGGGAGAVGSPDATGLALSEIFEFVGLRSDSWRASTMHHLVSSSRFPWGATVSYGVREHAFLLPSEPIHPSVNGYVYMVYIHIYMYIWYVYMVYTHRYAYIHPHDAMHT